jgi:hypothetical protein
MSWIQSWKERSALAGENLVWFNHQVLEDTCSTVQQLSAHETLSVAHGFFSEEAFDEVNRLLSLVRRLWFDLTVLGYRNFWLRLALEA